MESAIALLFFAIIILLMIGLVVQMQADFISLSGSVQKILALERERAKENAEIVWRGRYDVMLRNLGTNTSIRYIYVYVNGSKVPTFRLPVEDLVTIVNGTLRPHYYSGGLVLGPNVRVRLNLEQFGHWRILYNLNQIASGSSALLQVPIPSDTDPGRYFPDERFLNTSWLDFGADGYALYRNLSAITRPRVNTGLSTGENWTACLWLRIIDHQNWGSPWTVLDIDSIQVMVDPNFNGSEYHPKIFMRVAGVDLEQGSDYVNATDWNHYCVVTNGTKMFFYVNGRLVDVDDQPSSLSVSYVELPHQQYEKAKVAAFDDLYIAKKYLEASAVRALAANAIFDPGAPYIYFSFDRLPNYVTRIDLVTDLGVVFSSSAPQNLLPG